MARDQTLKLGCILMPAAKNTADVWPCTVTKVSVKAPKQANEQVRKTDREREKDRVAGKASSLYHHHKVGLSFVQIAS